MSPQRHQRRIIFQQGCHYDASSFSITRVNLDQYPASTCYWVDPSCETADSFDDKDMLLSSVRSIWETMIGSVPILCDFEKQMSATQLENTIQSASRKTVFIPSEIIDRLQDSDAWWLMKTWWDDWTTLRMKLTRMTMSRRHRSKKNVSFVVCFVSVFCHQRPSEIWWSSTLDGGQCHVNCVYLRCVPTASKNVPKLGSKLVHASCDSTSWDVEGADSKKRFWISDDSEVVQFRSQSLLQSQILTGRHDSGHVPLTRFIC